MINKNKLFRHAPDANIEQFFCELCFIFYKTQVLYHQSHMKHPFKRTMANQALRKIIVA